MAAIFPKLYGHGLYLYFFLNPSFEGVKNLERQGSKRSLNFTSNFEVIVLGSSPTVLEQNILTLALAGQYPESDGFVQT